MKRPGCNTTLKVLDVWFEREVKPRLKERAVLVRYADDFVIVFKQEADARKVQEALSKRFGKHGLTLHPEKTRLVRFTVPERKSEKDDGDGDGGNASFDFLGFTHHWARSTRGYMVVMLKTAKSRFSSALKRVSDWCSRNRHMAVATQQRALSRKLRGHFGYFGVVGNATALWRFARAVYRTWRGWLHRRSQRARMTWERIWTR